MYKKAKTTFLLIVYYSFLRYLPSSTSPGGKVFKKLRYLCCRDIFKYCGKNVNIERLAYFGSGKNLKIGDNSGLGINCNVPSDIQIGCDVMMGPNVFILSANHRIDNLLEPMWKQGHLENKRTIIEDDIWIGRQVTFTPGRILQTGSIVGVGTVLTKDFPPFSIIGGNPSKLIRSRIQ